MAPPPLRPTRGRFELPTCHASRLFLQHSIPPALSGRGGKASSSFKLKPESPSGESIAHCMCQHDTHANCLRSLGQNSCVTEQINRWNPVRRYRRTACSGMDTYPAYDISHRQWIRHPCPSHVSHARQYPAANSFKFPLPVLFGNAITTWERVLTLDI